MFKQGDRVICIKDCEKSHYCAKKGDTGVMVGSVNILTLYGLHCNSLNNWRLINKQMKTLDNLEVGDLLKKGFCKVKVLAVLPGLIGVSSGNRYIEFNEWVTLDELRNSGYTPYQEPEVKELTVKEISEKLGYEVKIIKE